MMVAEEILEGFQEAKSAHTDFQEIWQDCSDYGLPRHGQFTGPRRDGDDLQKQIFDRTAVRALNKAAAGLFSRASNPNTQWFFMTVHDGTLLDESPDAKIHLATVDRRMSSVINSQLSAPLFQIYKVLLGLGTGALFIEEDAKNVLRGVVFPLKDIFIKTDHMNDVDTVYRKFELTANQATKKWDSELLSQELRDAAVSSPDNKFTFLHVVMPRADAIKHKIDNLNHPIASYYLQLGQAVIIEEGGYHEMPYMIPRLDIADDERYGRCPMMEVIDEVKTVNAMVALTLDAANMSIRPAMDVPVGSYITPFRLTPAAINQNQEPGTKASPINTFSGDINITFNVQEQLRVAIRDSFFNDQIELINQKNMTATEVLERVDQNMFLLGPWLIRLEKELFKPMIDRVFGIMNRKGMFPPVPESLSKANLKIVYDSPLARAQRTSEVQAIDDMTAYIERAALINPGVIDNFNFDHMARTRAEIKGLDHESTFSEDEVMETREAEAQAAADAAQAEQASQLLDGAGALAQLPGGAEIVSETLSAPPPEQEELEEAIP